MRTLPFQPGYAISLDNEIDFLASINPSKSLLVKYVRLKKGLDEGSFAECLNLSLNELKLLEKDKGKPSARLKNKLKEVLGY